MYYYDAMTHEACQQKYVLQRNEFI